MVTEREPRGLQPVLVTVDEFECFRLPRAVDLDDPTKMKPLIDKGLGPIDSDKDFWVEIERKTEDGNKEIFKVNLKKSDFGTIQDK